MSTPNQRKEWAKKLKRIEGYDGHVKESESLGGTVPDGRYEADVTSAEFGTSANGRDQIVVKMKIVNHEEQDDATCATFMGIDATSLKYTLATLRRLGFEIAGDNPEELLDIVEELGKSKMNINIKIKDGFVGILDSNDVHVSDSENKEEQEEEEEDEQENVSEEGEDGDSEDEDSDDEEESEENTDSGEESEISEGDKVTWKDGKTSKSGEIIEVMEDKNLARIETSEGKIIRVDISKLVKQEEEEESDDEDNEEDSSEEDDQEEVEEKPVKRSAVKKSVVKKTVAKKSAVKKTAKRK